MKYIFEVLFFVFRFLPGSAGWVEVQPITLSLGTNDSLNWTDKIFLGYTIELGTRKIVLNSNGVVELGLGLSLAIHNMILY